MSDDKKSRVRDKTTKDDSRGCNRQTRTHIAFIHTRYRGKMSAFTLSNTATARAVFVAKYVRDRRGHSRVAPARWVRSIERIIGRDRSIGGLDGGSIDESFLKKSRGSSNFPIDGWIRLNDRTTKPTTTGPTEPTTRTTRTTRTT